MGIFRLIGKTIDAAQGAGRPLEKRSVDDSSGGETLSGFFSRIKSATEPLPIPIRIREPYRDGFAMADRFPY